MGVPTVGQGLNLLHPDSNLIADILDFNIEI